MHPVRVLLPALLVLAACGGSAGTAVSPAPTTTSPSPTADPLEAARHSTCLDFRMATRLLVGSTDYGEETAAGLEELALELEIDAGLYAAAGDDKTSALLLRMAADAEELAPDLRAEEDPNAAITRYQEFVDGLIDEFGRDQCTEELAA